MLKAEYTLSELPNGEYTLSELSNGDSVKGRQEQEFETISELEQFIAYNRAYFIHLQFWGSFKREEI